MSIYDQNHSTINTQLTPPDKRSDTMLAWGRALTKPIQWLHDLFFIDYAQGNNSAQYDPSVIYNVGDRVQFQHQVYEVWVGPTVAGTDPTNTANWELVSDDFRGADQRVLFSSQVLVFEFLLNQWFGTVFRQPFYVAPPATPAKSDIWIEQTAIIDGSFIMRPDPASISFMRPDGHNSNFMRPDHLFNTVNFIVHYPISVIPDASVNLNQLKSLVNQYKLGGTVPGYQSY